MKGKGDQEVSLEKGGLREKMDHLVSEEKGACQVLMDVLDLQVPRGLQGIKDQQVLLVFLVRGGHLGLQGQRGTEAILDLLDLRV